MDVEGADIVKVVSLPDLFHQPRSGEHLARVQHENLEQAALQRGEVICPRRPCNLAMLYLEGYSVNAQHPISKGSCLHALYSVGMVRNVS